jgi:hypothetical protein
VNREPEPDLGIKQDTTELRASALALANWIEAALPCVYPQAGFEDSTPCLAVAGGATVVDACCHRCAAIVLLRDAATELSNGAT